MLIILSGDREKYYSNINNDLLVEYKTQPGSLNGTFHFHDNYELLLCLSDDMFCETESGRLNVRKNSMLLFNSMDLHHYAPIEKSGENIRYTIHFDPSFLTDISVEAVNLTYCFLYRPFENAWYLPLSDEQAEQIRSLAKRLIEVKNSDSRLFYGKSTLLQLQLAELLILVNSYYRCYHNITDESRAAGKGEIYELIEYIHTNFTEELSLDMLARKFYVNKCNLCENFKKITGLTPNNYIINCRIARAKNLLISGSSVETACSESGFNNLSHFSRIFKQRVGQSPKQYQKTMKLKYSLEQK